VMVFISKIFLHSSCNSFEQYPVRVKTNLENNKFISPK
jgi:hypothetical protein